jgi:hypothetical protein
MCISNSGFSVNLNRFFILLKYIVIRKVVAKNPLLLIHQTVGGNYNLQTTFWKSLKN